jgi:hypothetical protein
MGCVKERCRGKRYCLLWDRQRMEPAAFHAQKTIASRFYQLRMNKAPIGPYLAEVRQAADDRCCWCSNESGSGPSQTREHFFQHCNLWNGLQATM